MGDSSLESQVELTERVINKTETNMTTTNLINTFTDQCRITDNTKTIESLASIETLKQFTENPNQLTNADLLIYIMSSETDVHKVIAFTKTQLEKLTDHDYFFSLFYVKSLQKHSTLGTDLTCLKIPDVNPENVHKCLQFISNCADEKLMSTHLLKTEETRFMDWICDNFFKTQDASFIEAYKIFDFLRAQVYVDLAEKYLKKCINSANVFELAKISAKFEKECEKYVIELAKSKVKTVEVIKIQVEKEIQIQTKVKIQKEVQVVTNEVKTYMSKHREVQFNRQID